MSATAQEGRPWSCPDARVSLSLAPAGGATLVVEDATGRVVERHVESPRDLVPTGEALLASPVADEPVASGAAATPDIIAPAAPPVRNPNPPSAPALPDRATATPSRLQEPRLLLQALVGPRYAGETHALWGGGQLRAMIPLGSWSAGLWARYDLPALPFDPTPDDFSMSEASVGALAGRRLLSRPFELIATIDASLVVLTMEGGEEPEHAEGGKVDGRIGVGLRAALPLGDMWRGVVAVDGELAPAGLGGSEGRRIDEALPPIPAYTAGMALGVEVAIP